MVHFLTNFLEGSVVTLQIPSSVLSLLDAQPLVVLPRQVVRRQVEDVAPETSLFLCTCMK